MSAPAHQTIYRKDYTPPDYLVDTIELRFELGEETTRVHSRMAMRKNPDAAPGSPPLHLDGRRSSLPGLILDGMPLASDRYALDSEGLTIPDVPASFILEVTTEIRPRDNTYLEDRKSVV